MNIQKINFNQQFKANSVEFNDNNISVSKTNKETSDRWFVDATCSAQPIQTEKQNKELIEVTPENITSYRGINIKLPNRIEYYTEYFIDDYTPVKELANGVVVENKGRLRVINSKEAHYFNGSSVKYKNDTPIEEISYVHGYPYQKIEYKDGDVYKKTRYALNSTRRIDVESMDGSFKLSQNISDAINTKIELITLNVNGQKMFVEMSAAKEFASRCKCECAIPQGDKYRITSLEWSYPDIKYSFYGNQKDAKDLQNALKELSYVIQNEEYKDDFGSTKYFNVQLNDAINYLKTI